MLVCAFAVRLKVALTGILKIKATVAVAMAAVWDVAVVMRVSGHLPEHSPSVSTHTYTPTALGHHRNPAHMLMAQLH